MIQGLHAEGHSPSQSDRVGQTQKELGRGPRRIYILKERNSINGIGQVNSLCILLTGLKFAHCARIAQNDIKIKFIGTINYMVNCMVINFVHACLNHHHQCYICAGLPTILDHKLSFKDSNMEN